MLWLGAEAADPSIVVLVASASAHVLLCLSTVVEPMALAPRTGALTHLQPVMPHKEKVLSLHISTEESWDLPPAPPVFLHSRGVGSPVPQPLGVGWGAAPNKRASTG